MPASKQARNVCAHMLTVRGQRCSFGEFANCDCFSADARLWTTTGVIEETPIWTLPENFGLGRSAVFWGSELLGSKGMWTAGCGQGARCWVSPGCELLGLVGISAV